jgi:hypothetical protein
MKSVYISSTYEDLKAYRRAVADALRQCDYNVDAMEKYPAREDRPKEACEADASNCDLYLGLFAWRYGFIPPQNNPERKSITELEYLSAGRTGKPRLIFMLADAVDWPSSLRDAESGNEGKRIGELRARLREEKWVGFFKSPDDLARQVLVSVVQHEATKRVENITGLVKTIQSAPQLGTSYLPNIQDRIPQATSFVAIDVGATTWWDTRLHLVAALASDFTDIRQLVLLENERFLAMASPAELRRALTNAEPRLEIAYLKGRQWGRANRGNEMMATIERYQKGVTDTFKGAESEIKRDLNAAAIRNLGIRQEGEAVNERKGQDRPQLYAEIIRRNYPYVVLMRDGMLEGVVDRVELASGIANAVWRP